MSGRDMASNLRVVHLVDGGRQLESAPRDLRKSRRRGTHSLAAVEECRWSEKSTSVDTFPAPPPCKKDAFLARRQTKPRLRCLDQRRLPLHRSILDPGACCRLGPNLRRDDRNIPQDIAECVQLLLFYRQAVADNPAYAVASSTLEQVSRI